MSTTRRINREWTFQRAAYTFLRVVLPIGSEIQGSDAAGGTQRQRQLNAQRGIVAGWPDMQCEVEGFASIYFELKAPGGTASAEQQRRGENLIRLGRHWFCVQSLGEIEQHLRHLGVPLRGTTLSAQERDERLQQRMPTRTRTRKPRADKPTIKQVAKGNKLAIFGIGPQ